MQMHKVKQLIECEMMGSDGSDDEDACLLGCDTV